MATDYRAMPIETQVQKITAELAHCGQLQQAAQMWQDARTQIDMCHQNLGLVQQKLFAAWEDGAYTELGNKISYCQKTLYTWVENIDTAKIAQALKPLPDTIKQTHTAVTALYDEYRRSNSDGSALGMILYWGAAGEHMNKLAKAYEDVQAKMAQAHGPDWDGPRKATADPAASGPATPGTTPASSSKAAPDGPTTPDQSKKDPSDPAQPANQDSTKDLLDEGMKAVDALSQAAQSLQQLLGGSGSDLSGLAPTAGDFNPASLASMSPADLTNYLHHLGSGSGLPTLAGLDGGGGLGGGGVGSGVGIPAVPDSAPASAAQTAAAVTPLSTAGTAATSSGAIPPMYPQRGAGARTGGGIKPGDAEDVRTSRQRKAVGTPGVSLRGRAGKGRRPQSPAEARPRPAVEDGTGQLLDEELWQVKREDDRPRRGTWPQQK